MEDKAVEKFDPAKLMDGVKDRIKATFVSLIDDNKWEELVQATQKQFFDKRQVNKGTAYNPIYESAPSEFEQLVLDELRAQCKAILTELFKKPEYSVNQVWGQNAAGQYGNHSTLSEHLDNMIKEKMPDMLLIALKEFMGGMFFSFFNDAQNKLRQNGYHG